jgi:hypothetical protein
MTPAEIALLITLVQAAITQGEAMYTASQLKDLAELETKLQAQLTATQGDRATANADIDTRDKELEDELAAAPEPAKP